MSSCGACGLHGGFVIGTPLPSSLRQRCKYHRRGIITACSANGIDRPPWLRPTAALGKVTAKFPSSFAVPVSALRGGRLNSDTASAVPTARIARLSVALLLTINMFNYVDRYVLAATLTPIKRELFSPNDESADFWMGMLFTAFLVSYMCTAPVFGWLADRRSRWKLIGAAVVIWSLASGASGLAHVFGTLGIVSTFTALLITRLFVGIGEAAYGPAAPTVISDLFPIKRRGSVLAWFYMAIPVGSAVGYVWGGTISKLLDWHWAFYLVVPPGMLLGLLCFLMPEPVRGAAEASSDGTAKPTPPRHMKLADYWTFARTPSYVLNTAGMTAMTFAIGGVAAWMPTYVHEFRKEPDLGHVNTIFGLITVVSGISATLLGGVVADRLSARFQVPIFSFPARRCCWDSLVFCSCS